MRRFAPSLLLLTVALVGGCANPWKDSFERNRDLQPLAALPKTQQPALREVEFERLQKFTQEERARRIDSTTAPADLTPEQRVEAKNRLLEALQLPWRGDDADVIGSSQFTSSEELKPHADKRLFDFARGIGAEVIVLASTYLGQTQRFTTVPVTSYTRDTVTYSYDRRGRRVPMTTFYDSSSTTWVPMNVTEDQFVYHAFFIRRPVRTDGAGSNGTR
jgi:hypothetical protein